MSREIVDLSVLPIDVGFDLRVQSIAVSISADTRSAAYDVDGEEHIIRGSIAQIVRALESAGYTCVVAP